MVSKSDTLKIGDRVTVPWGLDEDVDGRVVDIWGDPPDKVRVELDLGDEEEPEVLLLNARIVKRVA